MVEEQDVHPRSLMAHLRGIPDPRRRQGRRYPLAGVLAMLILGAMNGQSSLRGMWLWAKAHKEELWEALGFFTHQGMPCLSRVWGLLTQLDAAMLESQLSRWLEGGQGPRDEAISVDGKTLRGSRRAGQEALRVVSVVGHATHLILRQEEAAGGDEIAAALRLLKGTPLAGRTVTMDAGLLQRPIVAEVLAQGGEYVGVLKGNHPVLKAAVDELIEGDISPSRAIASA